MINGTWYYPSPAHSISPLPRVWEETARGRGVRPEETSGKGPRFIEFSLGDPLRQPGEGGDQRQNQDQDQHRDAEAAPVLGDPFGIRPGPLHGRPILQEREGLRVLVDLTKQDKSEAIAALEEVFSQLKN